MRHLATVLSPILLSLIATLPLEGCSVALNGKTNFAFGQPSLTTGSAVSISYSGIILPVVPVFAVFKLQNPPTLFTDFSDSVSVAAFSDNKCNQAAAGTITAVDNPQTISQGLATFTNLTYTHAGIQEENIYLSGTLVNNNVTFCNPSHIGIIQHFSLGFGYTSPGIPGAAGASTAASIADSASVVRIDSKGNYVVAGTSKNVGGGKELVIWRYLANGALDTSFNTVGYFHSGTTGAAGATAAAELDSVTDLQIDSNGKYVLVGTSVNAAGGTELAVWRYKTDGTLDTSFATTGVFHTGSPGLTGRTPLGAIVDQPKSVKLDSNGNIVVAGSSKNAGNGTELFVARLTSAGVLDTSFAGSGIYHSGTTGAAGATGATENDVGNALQIDSQGNYLLVGASVLAGTSTELAVWKLTSTGSLSAGFGNAGIVTFGSVGAAQGSGANLADVGRSLQIDANGNLIISGSSKNSSGGIEMAVWQYSSSGILASTFGATGYFVSGGAAGAVGASMLDVGTSVAIDSLTNTYVVSGTSVNASGGTQTSIWRLTTSGALDSAFNNIGVAVTSSSGAASGMNATTVNDTSASVQVDAYGTYILVGAAKNSAGGTQLAIWRYLPLGTLDI